MSRKKKEKRCLKLIRPVHPAASTDSTDSYIENETSPWSCFFTFTREKRSYHKSHLLNVYVMGAFFSPPRSNHSKLLDWVTQYFSVQNSDGFVTLSFLLYILILSYVLIENFPLICVISSCFFKSFSFLFSNERILNWHLKVNKYQFAPFLKF